MIIIILALSDSADQSLSGSCTKIGYSPAGQVVLNDSLLCVCFSCFFFFLCFSSSSARFSSAQLLEVNAHSLFSKWFSESGKLVMRLFHAIREMVEEKKYLVVILIGMLIFC